MTYDEETLMAYADGELEPAQRAEIEAAIARDAALAERVQQHRALRTRVGGAFGGVLGQPVPEALRAAAAAPPRGVVVPFPAQGARSPATPWRAREWFAMAASVLLGVVLSWQIFAPKEQALVAVNGGAMVARGPLAAALERQLANTQPRDGAILIGLTFRSQDGSYCRSFAVRAADAAGLACRVNGDWRIPMTTTVELPANAMLPASSATPPAVLAAVEARIAGEPFDVPAEAAAVADAWPAPPK